MIDYSWPDSQFEAWCEEGAMDAELRRDSRHICTAVDPWTPEKSKRAEHPDAVSVDETDYGLQRLKTGDNELCAECEQFVDESLEREVAAYFHRRVKDGAA